MQQLNSDIGSIAAWLEKTGAELEALKLAEPPSDIQEMALRVKRLQVSGAVGEGRPGLGVAGSIRVACADVCGFYTGFSFHMTECLQKIPKPRRAQPRYDSGPQGWKDVDCRLSAGSQHQAA